jgi:hypothetical protein
MKTVELLLPDGVYEQALAKAHAEGFDTRHYLSNLVIEQIQHSRPPTEGVARETTEAPSQPVPDTVEQILRVCAYVWRSGYTFPEAVRRVANDLNIHETTVRDKCSRRISFPNAQVSLDMFLEMLSERVKLRDYLCRRFPKHDAEIRRRFDELIAGSLVDTAARDKIMRSLDDTDTW